MNSRREIGLGNILIWGLRKNQQQTFAVVYWYHRFIGIETSRTPMTIKNSVNFPMAVMDRWISRLC